jgi:hypothetical protein
MFFQILCRRNLRSPSDLPMRSLRLAGLALLMSVVAPAWVQAQAVGRGGLGRNLGPAARGRANVVPPPAEATGVISGSERFLRENRDPRAFVGGSRAEQQSFVGSQQALGSGRVQAATESLRPTQDSSRRVNRPLPPLPATGLYYPRLELSSELVRELQTQGAGRPASQRRQRSEELLNERLQRLTSLGAEVRIEGRTAIIQGELDSERSRTLLISMLQMEAGIDEVVDLARISPVEGT